MISVVIITKNEERVIKETVRTCKQFTDDVVVLDSGSTDETIEKARQAGALVHHQDWLGYGMQKNRANQLAKYDWILSLDADERPDAQMIQVLQNMALDKQVVYCFKLIDHFGNRPIRFSELRPKWKKRLFNRQNIAWDQRAVHEQLILTPKTTVVRCPGNIMHYSYDSFSDFEKKIIHYGRLGGQTMARTGKKLSLIKRIFNPYFRFFRSYLLYLGFLEGILGWKISKTLAYGLRVKYQTYDIKKASK